MSPTPAAEQAQCLHAARAQPEETRRLEVVMVPAPQRNSSCTTLIFVMWGMSGCVAGGTEMSLLTFYTFRFFSLLFLEKGSPYWGKFIGFSVNEFCVCVCFFTPTFHW